MQDIREYSNNRKKFHWINNNEDWYTQGLITPLDDEIEMFENRPLKNYTMLVLSNEAVRSAVFHELFYLLILKNFLSNLNKFVGIDLQIDFTFLFFQIFHI